MEKVTEQLGMTREQALAEAAEKYALKVNPGCKLRGSGSALVASSNMDFLAGADWEAQRSAVLLEALEKIMERTVAGVIRVERGQPNGLDATALDNIARAALSSYRAKRGE